jgi:site-specific DNA-methyltransferase (adenine-specific)
MRAQLNLFTNQDPSTVVAFWPVSDEAQGTEGTPMSISREKAPLEETPPAGLSAPRLTTTHGVLYQADCLELLGALRSESVSTVFADPPFNLQKEYRNGFQDQWRDEDYLSWAFRWIDECCRVLVPGGAFFIYVLPRLAFHFAAHLDGPLEFRHWIALSMKGTFPRGQKLYPAHYSLLYFTKGKPRIFNRVRVPIPSCRHCGGDLKDYGGHRKYLNPEGLNLTDFWEDTSPNRHRNSKSRPGVNELKPMIPSRAIEISSGPGDIVLDPFGGGGSTFQEAQRLGRYWIGSEIGHCDAIEQRFRDFAPTTLGRKPPREVLAVLSE